MILKGAAKTMTENPTQIPPRTFSRVDPLVNSSQTRTMAAKPKKFKRPRTFKVDICNIISIIYLSENQIKRHLYMCSYGHVYD